MQLSHAQLNAFSAARRAQLALEVASACRETWPPQAPAVSDPQLHQYVSEAIETSWPHLEFENDVVIVSTALVLARAHADGATISAIHATLADRAIGSHERTRRTLDILATSPSARNL